MRIIQRLAFALPLMAAPWLYGTTEPWSVALIQICLGFAIVLSAIGSYRAWLREGKWFLVFSPWLFFLILVYLQAFSPLTVPTHQGILSFPPELPLHPFSVRAPLTWAQGISWTLLLFFCICFFFHLQTRKDLRFFVTLVTVNAGLLSFVGLMMYFSQTDSLLWVRKPRFGGGWGYIFGPFVSRNNFAAYVNLLLPFALAGALYPSFALRSPSAVGPQRLTSGLIAALIMAAVVCCASRGGVLVSLVIILGALLVSFFLPSQSRTSLLPPGTQRILFLVFWVVALVLLAGNAGRLWERIMQPETFRPQVYQDCLRAIQLSPYFGFGLGSFAFVYPTFQSPSLTQFLEDAHNDWIQFLMETGFTGLSILSAGVLVGFFFLAKMTFSKKPVFYRALAAAVFLALAGVLLHAMADFPFQIYSIRLTFGMLMGLGLATFRVAFLERKPSERQP